MNETLKLCVCTFTKKFSPTGIFSAPFYLTSQLRRYFKNVDLISLSSKEDYVSSIDTIRCEKDPKVLEDYDFVVFSTPGFVQENPDSVPRNKYIDILKHAKKYTFVFNDEYDRSFYPFHQDFLSQDNLAFVTFNCPGMAEIFSDYLDFYNCEWEHIGLSPIMRSKSEILRKATLKSNKIMSTSRWSDCKRIVEFLQLARDFNKSGLDVYTAGSHLSHFYNMRVDKEVPKDTPYTDLGEFEPSQLPEILKDVKYHWNFLFQKRRMGLRTHMPRVELATLEALNEGCLPIVCSEFTPEWLGFDSAIRVSKDDYKCIPDIVRAIDINSNERLDRVSLLYDRVEENITNRYSGYADRIIKSCM